MTKQCPICKKNYQSVSGKVCSRCKTWYRRYQRKLEIIELMGGKCSECECDDIWCLDCHHIDPSTKEHAIGHILGNKLSTIKKELEKCILLCANCHRKKHKDIRQDVILYYENRSNNTKEIQPRKRAYKPHYIRRVVNRPLKEELEKLVWEKPISHIAKDYNLHPSSVRTWCIQYNIKYPGSGYWPTFKSRKDCG